MNMPGSVNQDALNRVKATHWRIRHALKEREIERLADRIHVGRDYLEAQNLARVMVEQKDKARRPV